MRRRLPTGLPQHCLWLLVSVLLTLSNAELTRAESVEMAVQNDEPAEYREQIDEALREFSVQNYEESRSLFLQAHALMPSARTLRALGLCEYELRNYGESVRYLQEALASKRKPLSQELRDETERMIMRARNFVGRLAVELRPAGALLTVDGVKAETSKGEPVWLSMGDHMLEASAPGFVSEKRKLNVKGGEDQKLSFILMRGDDKGPAVDTSSKPASEKRWYKSPWLWTAVGVVVVGGAAATAIVLTRDSGSNTPNLPAP